MSLSLGARLLYTVEKPGQNGIPVEVKTMSILSALFSREMAFAGLLLAFLPICPLRASTAYAYSENNASISISNGTTPGITSLASNTSTFSGFGTDQQSGPLDPPETKVGPGPFPGENSFGPQGPGGLGFSRADTLISSATLDGMGGENVAEAYRTNPGSASDVALDRFRFVLTPTVANQPITITILASPNMRVTTTGDGMARANIDFAVNIFDSTTHALLLAWFPDGSPLSDFTLNAGSVSSVEDPFNLNAEITCSGTCDQSYSIPGINEWTLSYLGAPGQKYDVIAGWDETVNVLITPEPASLGLTGIALILFRLMWRAHSCVPRRDLSRRLSPVIGTLAGHA
jgi:hypothetical protein